MNPISINSRQATFLKGNIPEDKQGTQRQMYLRLCGYRDLNLPYQLRLTAFRNCSLLLASTGFNLDQARERMIAECPIGGGHCPLLERGIKIVNPPATSSIYRTGNVAASELLVLDQIKEFLGISNSPFIVFGLPSMAGWYKSKRAIDTSAFIDAEQRELLRRTFPRFFDKRVITNPDREYDPNRQFITFADKLMIGEIYWDLHILPGFEDWYIPPRLKQYHTNLLPEPKPIKRMGKFLQSIQYI